MDRRERKMAADDTMGELAEDVAAAFGGQLELHIELLKAEVSRDAGRLGHALLPLGLALPPLLLGYTLCCFAASVSFGLWLGPAAGPALVGGLNLAAGFVFAQAGIRRLRVRAQPTVAPPRPPAEVHHVG